jgi:hypothetical protein
MSRKAEKDEKAKETKRTRASKKKELKVDIGKLIPARMGPTYPDYF